jgi:glycosyltransferase involved in cell wall biosynthesis
VFEAVLAQARLIRSLGAVPRVFALDDGDAARDRARFEGVDVTVAAVVGPRQIGFAPSLLRAMIDADLDCLHLHGIWLHPSRLGYLWARRTGRPYFISPHGMLDPWITARGRWKKTLARAGYERASWGQATAFHALTARESRDIAAETGRSDSLVIANAAPPPSSERRRNRAPDLVYIGRIHPKKNLVTLIQGWMQAQRPPGARLRIAGWGLEDDIAELKRALNCADDTVEFLGPVYGEAKDQLISSARFMVLPSHSEGLPMAALEAWAAATPMIMTSECNLPQGFSSGAAIECGYDSAAIAVAVSRALALPEAQWHLMAQAAHELASGPFSAQAIAAQWASAYRLRSIPSTSR